MLAFLLMDFSIFSSSFTYFPLNFTGSYFTVTFAIGYIIFLGKGLPLFDICVLLLCPPQITSYKFKPANFLISFHLLNLFSLLYLILVCIFSTFLYFGNLNYSFFYSFFYFSMKKYKTKFFSVESLLLNLLNLPRICK